MKLKKLAILVTLVLASVVSSGQTIETIFRGSNRPSNFSKDIEKQAWDKVNKNDVSLRAAIILNNATLEDAIALKLPIADTSNMLKDYALLSEINSELSHAFIYFGGSAVSVSYTTAWAHFTNAWDSVFIQYELDGFTVSNDTITITNSGDYSFLGNSAHDGDNGETVSMRFFNVTQTEGIPVGGAQTMRGINNFGSTIVLGYGHITAGDKIVMHYKGDGNGTAVFKNSAILIELKHN